MTESHYQSDQKPSFFWTKAFLQDSHLLEEDLADLEDWWNFLRATWRKLDLEDSLVSAKDF